MKKNLLFLCVANSARSQMAEGLARHILPKNWEIQSAGSCPTHVHPMSLIVMREIGIDISDQTSKSVSSVDLSNISLIVTLCAEEVCPTLPGGIAREHWALPDPAFQTSSEDTQLNAFRMVRDNLKSRIDQFWGHVGEIK